MLFYGLETIACDRICYGVITHDNIYRVWMSPLSDNNWKARRNLRIIAEANVVIDLTNQRYIKHRNAEPAKLGRPSDEVRILFAHTKRYEIDPINKTTLVEINIPEPPNEQND